LIRIKRGLNLPINGQPEQQIYPGNPVTKVALIGPDFVGMKPDFAVAIGDTVKLGQRLFSDRKKTNIHYTAPGAGKVIEINRGEKRRFLSMVIELHGDAEITFPAYAEAHLQTLTRAKIIGQLLESGQWTAIRCRPFERVANPGSLPHSIFITAMDTNPLAPDVEKIVSLKTPEFIAGLHIISKLTDGTIFLCKAKDAEIPTADVGRLQVEEFVGPHPAGNVGTHIHFLDPVYREKSVWHLMAQDVIAIGHLFTTGQIMTDRVVSIGGPSAKRPRLVKTRLGASLADLAAGEAVDGRQRVISGSVLHGYHATDAMGYLGRYHQQVTIIPEGGIRKIFGWLSPGFNLYSVQNIVLSKLFPRRKFDFNTDLNGGIRSMVPIGSYEKVMPLDILPTFLLRALAVDDIEESERLGCLELAEEDLALCTFVCPSKIEHGDNLRRVLTLIEKEG
jgi:Na+-transporting NADH:ubiquinone oxidoreductase subunit A